MEADVDKPFLRWEHLTYTATEIQEFKIFQLTKKSKITKRSPTKKQNIKLCNCIYKYEREKESNTLDRTANCYTDIISKTNQLQTRKKRKNNTKARREYVQVLQGDG
jgi:hypothetical protein